MTQRRFVKDIKEKTERLTVGKVLHVENARLIGELSGERQKNASLMSEKADLRVHNERLKIRADFSLFGDGLLTMGSIGFGVLSVCGRDMLPDHVFLSCLGGTLVAAVIGLILKLFTWFRQR
jgi:hypothetical protein